MAIALVVATRDVGQLAQPSPVQTAVGYGDAEHVGVQLQVDAVHQPQGLELVLGQTPAQPAFDLIGELGDPLADQGRVELVIAVHQLTASRLWPTVGPPARMVSRSRSRPAAPASSASMR